jgi:hypothetical protein
VSAARIRIQPKNEGNQRGCDPVEGEKRMSASDRPDGSNVWLTFAISPAAPPH